MAYNNEINTAWDDNPVDVTKEVNFIWSIANRLRGAYKSDKYKDVIIPMVIIRRFECALASTKQAVLDTYSHNPGYPAKAMYQVSGYHFYNTSYFDLTNLLHDADNIASNFKSYINGFSDNIKTIITDLKFIEQIDLLEKNNRLYSIVKAFSEIDLDPKTIDNIKMGYIFEELIRKFSENAEAGDHYTGRDIIKLMVNILLSEGCDDIFKENKVITILDQACGTGGMLSTAHDFIKHLNPTAEIKLFGQEINDESYAICLAEMLIKGQDAENIAFQDTMIKDSFPHIKMRFVIENPPFGEKWGGKEAGDGVEQAVEEEYKKGSSGRFPAGLPGVEDMQLLFVQSAVNKMDNENGRAAIIENGSPLFTGGTSSGESQIRKYLLEKDLIEAIIALPTELFYNTGIATYIWILSKNKSAARKGKIQLIDASSFYHRLRKSLGNKRNEITPEDRKAVTKLYADFKENEFCKIFNNEEFIYKEYTIMQPLQRSYGITAERIENLIADNKLKLLYDEGKVYELENKDELTSKEQSTLEKFYNNKPLYDKIMETLKRNISDKIYLSIDEFMPVINKVLESLLLDKKIIEKITDGLSIMDKKAVIQKDKKGNILYDTATKDTEIIKLEENIDKYMAKEVLPYIPDAKAFFEEDLSKKNPVIKTGAEIPFTKYFYKYAKPAPSADLQQEILLLEKASAEKFNRLFS